MINVTSITLNKTSFKITWNQWYDSLEATVLPANATCRCVKWTSSNTAVASVNPSTGKVYGVEVGTATIYATALDGTGVCASCTVTVVAPATSIRFPKTREYVCKNSTITFSNILRPTSSVDEITWSSSDTSIATVNSNGKVTGKKVGTVTITARAKEVSGTVTVCVVNKEITVRMDGNTHNKIQFGDKEWLCINKDYTNSEIWIDTDTKRELVDRMGHNCYNYYNEELNGGSNPKQYSDDELRIIYAIDPQGFIIYVKNAVNADGNSLEDTINYKDHMYRVLFGADIPINYYTRDSSGKWHGSTSKPSTMSTAISESELLFGAHPVYDSNTWVELASLALTCVLTAISAGVGLVAGATGQAVMSAISFVSESLFDVFVRKEVPGWYDIASGTADIIDTANSYSPEYSLSWALDLLDLSTSFGNVASAMSSKPDGYKNALALCSDTINSTFKNHAVFFIFKNGEKRSAYEILEKVS